MLAKAGKYDNCLFHRMVPGFMVSTPCIFHHSLVSNFPSRFKQETQPVQEQEANHTGESHSETSTTSRVQHHMTVEEFSPWRTKVLPRMGECNPLNEHTRPLLRIYYRSQWYLTFRPTPHLDKKHTVFGKLVGGEDVLDTIEKMPVKPGTERPAKPIRIIEVIMYVCPSSLDYAPI